MASRAGLEDLIQNSGLCCRWCHYFALDIAERSYYRSQNYLRKIKFREALRQGREDLLVGGYAGELLSGRKSLLRSISYYDKKGDISSASSVRAIVWSNLRPYLSRTYVYQKLISISRMGIECATHRGILCKEVYPGYINEEGLSEIDWQYRRLSYLRELSSRTDRLWILHESPEKLPLLVPEDVCLIYGIDVLGLDGRGDSNSVLLWGT